MFERLKSSLRRYRLYRAVRFGYHVATDPVFRHDQWLRLRRPGEVFQYRSITAADRYPGIFEFVASRFRTAKEPRLLSFGCASGEEVFALRKRFPGASIKGIDLNPHNIAACRKLLARREGGPGIAFEVGGSAENEKAASYDAVFCLAVFQRPELKNDPAVATSAPRLLFASFDRVVSGLAAAVKPHGFLVIRHSMFRFGDTAAARNFQTVLRLPSPAGFFPRFDPADRRLPDEPAEDVVFQKRG
jgi:SAM-dependent methyltransferase